MSINPNTSSNGDAPCITTPKLHARPPFSYQILLVCKSLHITTLLMHPSNFQPGKGNNTIS